MKKKSNAGRPTVMNEETLKKLREGFAMALTDEEACLYADITPKTLYNYCEVNPEYLQYKEQLKKRPGIKAKANILKSINEGDQNNSKRWLERKSREEFSLKTEQEISGKDGGLIGIEVKHTGEQLQKIAEDILRLQKVK